MIPTSIDGTDITGATIDGTDVQEITVDGDVVFSGAPPQPTNLPVAYSNLVAWYPFDSATYGGGNADDVTAIFNPSQSGDSTAYDGTLNGPTFQSSAGVTDINAGSNSGGLSFTDTDNFDVINMPNSIIGSSDRTICVWIKDPDQGDFVLSTPGNRIDGGRFNWTLDSSQITLGIFNGKKEFNYDVNAFDGSYHWYGVTIPSNDDLSNTKMYQDGQELTVINTNLRSLDTQDGYSLGTGAFGGSDYDADDLRFYDTDLTSSQMDQIYQNTQP